MICGLVTRMRILVGMASDLVAYKALVVTHVLCMLGGEESDGIDVHSIGVVMIKGRQQLVSSRGNVGVISRTQLLESLDDIKKN